MTKQTFTFEVEVSKFEPGEKVIYDGQEFIVREWREPLYAGDEAIVFLEGKVYGVSADQCREVKNVQNPSS
jgi:hypothetical protein